MPMSTVVSHDSVHHCLLEVIARSYAILCTEEIVIIPSHYADSYMAYEPPYKFKNVSSG